MTTLVEAVVSNLDRLDQSRDTTLNEGDSLEYSSSSPSHIDRAHESLRAAGNHEMGSQGYHKWMSVHHHAMALHSHANKISKDFNPGIHGHSAEHRYSRGKEMKFKR